MGVLFTFNDALNLAKIADNFGKTSLFLAIRVSLGHLLSRFFHLPNVCYQIFYPSHRIKWLRTAAKS